MTVKGLQVSEVLRIVFACDLGEFNTQLTWLVPLMVANYANKWKMWSKYCVTGASPTPWYHVTWGCTLQWVRALLVQGLVRFGSIRLVCAKCFKQCKTQERRPHALLHIIVSVLGVDTTHQWWWWASWRGRSAACRCWRPVSSPRPPFASQCAVATWRCCLQSWYRYDNKSLGCYSPGD